MQGTLSEIDLRSILQLIELGQRTGELVIESYPGSLALKTRRQTTATLERSCWFLFFVNGQLVYAADKTYGQLQRLQEYLRRYKLTDQILTAADSTLSTVNAPEYATLWTLLEKNKLTPVQARHVILSMVEETLFDLLNLRQGTFTFAHGTALDPPLASFAISPLMAQMAKQIQQWKYFHPHIQSPDQTIVVGDTDQLMTLLPEKLSRPLLFWANHQTSLRQLARYLHRNLPTVARSLYPYIEKGILHLVMPPSVPPDELNTPSHIVCIDDDKTVGHQVELFLSHYGYQVTIISDPLVAIAELFKIQPDLILCDITMPALDGYEMCGMLRQSRLFRHTPIVMLTGKEAFLDRVMARMVGATDYLTKPFGEQELSVLLETYLK